MPLDDQELSEIINRAIPDDLPEDPHVSYRPERWTWQSDQPTADLSANQIRLAKWAVSRDEEDEEEGAAAYGFRCKVGRGGFGEVWEAVQASLGRLVAVKRLREDHVEQAQDIPHEGTRMEADFRREALTTALLEHPNIVPVHDLGLDPEGKPLLAMKLVNGQRWDLMLKEDFESLDANDYVAKHIPVFLDMCQAVAFAHSRGIVHRDLKPSQVMVGEFGEVLLMDWGLAVLYDASLAKEKFQDTLELLVPTPDTAFSPTGTAAFMAVEQTADSARDVGPWTDVYLLGGTLYYMLTRRAPHGAKTAMESFVQASAGVVEPPEKRLPDRLVPPELSAICMKAMSTKFEDRYGSVTELIEAVEEYMTGAGERRESMRLTEEAGKVLSRGASLNYREYTECNNLLLRALNLWPRNSNAKVLQQRVLEQFAELAIENGDLMLAELMADSLSSPEPRRRIRKTVEHNRRRAKSIHRQRRIFKTLIAVLLLLIVADIVLLFGYQKRSRESFESQLKIVRERERGARERIDDLEAQLGISPGEEESGDEAVSGSDE